MPAKKTAPRKATAKKATAKKATAKRATARKATARKATAKKATARKATARKATARKATAKKATAKKATAKKARRTTAGTMQARRGDHIVIDSPQVGSMPREGEVLKVIHGELNISYRVKWADGHETLIAPVAGTATIVRT